MDRQDILAFAALILTVFVCLYHTRCEGTPVYYIKYVSFSCLYCVHIQSEIFSAVMVHLRLEVKRGQHQASRDTLIKGKRSPDMYNGLS